MKTSKYLLVLSLIFVSLFLSAQNVQVNAVNFNLTTAPFYSCSAVPFKVTITNTGATQATDVKFTLHSADITLTPDDFVLSVTPASQTNYYYDAPSGVFWLSEPLLAGQALTVIIPVKINCSIFSQSPVPPNVNLDFTASVAGVDNLMNTNVGVITSSSCSISAGADKSICPGTTTQLNVTAGAIYSWTPSNSLSNPNIANPIATVNATTTYTVIVTNVNGCINVDQVKITALPRFFINGGYDHVTCPGYTLTFNPGPAASYSWSPTTGLSDPHAPNPSLTATTSIVYTLTATNAAGCQGTDEVTVTILPPTFVNAGVDQTICEGTSVTLNATGAPASTWSPVYTWSPAAGISDPESANPVVSPTVTTTYTVTSGYTPGYCSSSDQVTITVKPKPTVSLGPDKAICGTQAVSLRATGGGPSYTWTGATPSTTRPYLAVVRPTTTTTYSVSTSSANGCTATDDITITVNPIPVVSAGSDQVVCGVPSVVQLNATGANTYKWSKDNAYVTLSDANISDPTIRLREIYYQSIYTVTLTVTGTSSEGCTATDEVVITSSRTPNFNIYSTTRTVCLGGSTNLYIYSGGDWKTDKLVSTEWSPSGSLSDPNVKNPIATPLINTTYTVTGKNEYGCTATGHIAITVDPNPPLINAGLDQTICEGASIKLSATGSTAYTWTPSEAMINSNTATPTVSPTSTTMYTVKGNVGTGCAASDQVTITVNPKPVVDAGVDQTICNGNSATLMATGAVSYTWTPAPGLINTNTATASATSTSGNTYTVTGRDAFGCTNTDQVRVYVRPKFVVNAGYDDGLCTGVTGTLYASSAGLTSWSWAPADGLTDLTNIRPSVNPTITTTYTLTGINQYGCSNTDQVTIYRRHTPIVNAGPDRVLCNNDQITLTATSDRQGGVRSWITSNGPTLSNDYSVTFTPSSRTYTFKHTVPYIMSIEHMEASVSCTGTDEVKITVLQEPVIRANGRTFNVELGTLPAGVTVRNYVWQYSISYRNGLPADPYNYGSCVSNTCDNFPADRRYWRASMIYDLGAANGGGTCSKTTPYNLLPTQSNRIEGTESADQRVTISPMETLIAYPIPTENAITLELHSDHTLSEVTVYDLLNKKVLHVSVSGNQTDVDVSLLPTGIYILHAMDSEGEVFVKRIEVKK